MTVDILAVFAHPDDAELLCGGTLAKAAAQGRRVGILDLTAGEMGSAGTREQRAKEATAAATILGATRDCAGLPDAALRDDHDARRMLAGWIRKLQPKTVITHWPDARHPDHTAAAQLTRAASFLAGLKNFDPGSEPYRPAKLLYSLTYQETSEKPTFVVDISDHMEVKLNAIFAFGSQFTGRTAMGDVLGGGDRPLREQILAHHAHYGSLIRRAFGEPFYTRETIAVADVVGVEPRTF